MPQQWNTRVTAFTVTRDGPLWLMLRHRRLGVEHWELPGGHVDPGESLEEAAARETAEETGIRVSVGSLLASCVHEWQERRERRLICFFDARALTDDKPRVPRDESDLIEASWENPRDLACVSPFLTPLLEQHHREWTDAPIHFRMTHRLNTDGLWEPAPVECAP